MVIRPIISIRGCAIAKHKVGGLSNDPCHDKGWELEIVDSADFYCYNCLTFHRAEKIVRTIVCHKKRNEPRYFGV